MSVAACAELVRDGDRDRFLATMTAPVSLRPSLFALFAFNLELLRAAWASDEVLIGEMRLQYWRDIASGDSPPTSPIAEAVVETIQQHGWLAGDMLAILDARRFDLDSMPHQDDRAIWTYLSATSGRLAWSAGRLLGAGEADRAALLAFGAATGFARMMEGWPRIVARRRVPLGEESVARIPDLAGQAYAELIAAMSALRGKGLGPVLLTGCQAPYVLKRVQRDPSAMPEGRLQISEFRQRLRLQLAYWRNR